MGTFIIVIVGWVVSVCLHEFGHAVVAYAGGDYTVRDKGYLSLNPLAYTHPFYSILLPVIILVLGGIGLPGGAVYINDHLIRSRAWRTFTSLAGVMMTCVLVLLLMVPFWAGWIGPHEHVVLASTLAFLTVLQICAIIFNLIPLPPFDGFRAIEPYLPFEMKETMFRHANVIFFAVILAFWYVPAVGDTFWSIVFRVSNALGLDLGLIVEGYKQFQFWKAY